ncbi:thioredoxin family protein [Candidatus Saccharibacteria bacterium]|nr:thioredoxin family protein [Candidatus Saccharibacteria bacterium]
MTKKQIVLGIVAFLVVSGAVVAYALDQSNNANKNAAMKTQKNDSVVKKEAATSDDVAKGSDMSMVMLGVYIDYADYTANKAKYDNTRVVYFFHAPWCPTCKSIDTAVAADTSKIPSGVAIVKTDYDSATELRQKYGVTQQYTFVQVDKDGNEVKQWSATNYDDLVAGIQV